MTKENIKSPFNILFVDDEEMARKYFEKGLKHEFSILTAGNVEEAKKILDEHHNNIAVVITDQRMPGGNGIILLKYLRENYPHIIRLLTTAYSDLTEAIEAVNGGEILRYIQKPWDYNMLKAEMRQAIELFELRLERNQMLHEKIMVKRKMTRVERVKILLLFSKIFRFLNFSDLSVQNFTKRFVSNIQDINEDQDWESFDFGNQDILEAKFFLDLTDKIQNEVPNSNDYNLDKDITSSNLKSLIEETANNLGSSVNVEVMSQSQIMINSLSFNIIIEKLLKIASLSQAASIKIDNIENGISITLNVDQINLSESDNIFISNPNKAASEFYINLLICYLLAGHHGGTVDVVGDNQHLNCVIKIPNDRDQYSFISQLEPELIENIILTAMLC